MGIHVVSLLVVLACAAEAEVRTWTDATGNHSVQAELVEVKNGRVHLRKADGGLAAVPLARLSAADREYVERHTSRPTRTAAAAPDDWPCFRGPNHDGTLAAKLTLVSGEPEVVWRAKVGQGNGSMAIVAGRLFLAANGSEDNLVCLDARTGEKVWAVGGFNGGGNVTPSVEEAKVFALFYGDVPTASCVSAADGKTLWKASLPKSRGENHYGLAGSPRLWEDLVFYNVAGGAAVRKQSGEVVWAHEGHTAYATPVVFTAGGKPAVAFFTGDQLIARDARSGDPLWTIPWKTELHVNACDPIFLGDRVFLCSAYKRARSLYDVSGASPRVVWDLTRNGDGHAFSSGFTRGGGLFFYTGGGLARADLDGGGVLWESSGAGAGGGTLVGDTFIQIDRNGRLTAGPFDPAHGFKPALRAQAVRGTTFAMPAYWDGKVYARNEKGDLACVRIGK